MNNPLLQFSPPLTLATVFLILLETLPSCLCDRYADCSTEFICGNTRASFPFWGNGRPNGCGVPELELRCTNGIPSIRLNNINYRVLQLNQYTQILNIAREDFLNGFCLPNFVNTTLDSRLFDYLPSYKNLTFFYGCPTSFMPLSLPFNCNVSVFLHETGFVLPPATGLGSCNSSVSVPVSSSLSTVLSSSRLENALKEGFEVRWKVDGTECNSCINSKGACGFDFTSNQFTCYCRGQSSGSTDCSSSSSSPDNKPGSKSKGVSVGVGVGVGGAVLAGILLGGWCLVIMKRRRSKAAQMEIQDMPEPSPSSKDPPTSTTYFSPSISSDPIPKPDIEKGSSYFGVQVFSHKELEKATDNFDSSKELGDGGFGTVYLGKLDDGRMVAVKRLYESNMKRAEQFINEVQILAHLRHKNLVALYGCTSRRSQELLLVYEYIPNGTVADHLHGRRADSRLLTWPLRLNIAIGTADALAYLHASDVIHRDVKTNNILLDNKFSVKVADFGLSRLFPNDVSHVSTAPQGTPGYVDPEYYQCYQLTDKSDVYSFGVVLIELISSLEAVNTNRKREDINLANMAVSRIQNHSVNELVDPCLGFEKDLAIQKMVTAVAELAFLCLQHERVMRPTMKEVLRALKRIEKEYLRSDKAKVVDIRKDDVGLLKRVPMPHSPDSVVQDKWVSSSTTSDSF